MNAVDWFKRGADAAERGDLRAQLRAFQRVTELAPAWPRSWIALGATLIDLGRDAEAFDAFGRALALPTLSSAHRHDALGAQARCCERLGRLARAEALYRRAIEAKPTPEHWVLLGNVLQRRGHTRAPITCLRRALEVDPNYDEAHYILGQYYASTGRAALGERHLRRAIELDPNYALAYARLGEHLQGRACRGAQRLRASRLEVAFAALARAVKLDPDDHWSSLRLALAFWFRDELDLAEAQYRAAVAVVRRVDPGHRGFFLACYADFLSGEQRDRRKAGRLFRRAMVASPDDPQARYMYGRHLLRVGRRGGAIRELGLAKQLGHLKAERWLAQAMACPASAAVLTEA